MLLGILPQLDRSIYIILNKNSHYQSTDQLFWFWYAKNFWCSIQFFQKSYPWDLLFCLDLEGGNDNNPLGLLHDDRTIIQALLDGTVCDACMPREEAVARPPLEEDENEERDDDSLGDCSLK